MAQSDSPVFVGVEEDIDATTSFQGKHNTKMMLWDDDRFGKPSGGLWSTLGLGEGCVTSNGWVVNCARVGVLKLYSTELLASEIP